MINPPEETGFAQNARRVAVIACEVMQAEVKVLAAVHSTVGHVHVLPQGLHNDPPKLRVSLQQAIDEIEALPADNGSTIDTIVLAYGLCSRGAEGVTTRRCRLIIPRAHDCITLLLGGKPQYDRYMQEHRTSYFYSRGWIAHHVSPGPDRYKLLYDQYAEKYGQDNAEFLMEEEQHWMSDYNMATFIDLLGPCTRMVEQAHGKSPAMSPDQADELAETDGQYTKKCADWLGWQYDQQQGDPQLLHDLLVGPWDDQRFLVLEPGQVATMTADDRVIQAVTVHGEPVAGDESNHLSKQDRACDAPGQGGISHEQ